MLPRLRGARRALSSSAGGAGPPANWSGFKLPADDELPWYHPSMRRKNVAQVSPEPEAMEKKEEADRQAAVSAADAETSSRTAAALARRAAAKAAAASAVGAAAGAALAAEHAAAPVAARAYAPAAARAYAPVAALGNGGAAVAARSGGRASAPTLAPARAWAGSASSRDTSGGTYERQAAQHAAEPEVRPVSARIAYPAQDPAMIEAVMLAALHAHGIAYRRSTDGQLCVRDCPFCHPIKGREDNRWKLVINLSTGLYICFRCSAKGNSVRFTRELALLGDSPSASATMEAAATAAAAAASSSSSAAAAPAPAPAPVPAPAPGRREAAAWQVAALGFPVAAAALDLTPPPGRSGAGGAASRWATVERDGLLIPDAEIAGKWQAQLEAPAYAKHLRHVIASRGLGLEVLRKYRVGFRTLRAAREQEQEQEQGPGDATAAAAAAAGEPSYRVALTFPLFAAPGDFDGRAPGRAPELELQRLKMRDVRDKAWQRFFPYGPQCVTGLFGWHLVRGDLPRAAAEPALPGGHLVVTEGEFDAMAVHQATGLVAVSLPNGANSLPEAILEPLRRVPELVLWADADAAGQACATKLAARLGHRRCLVVPPDAAQGAKDANDALRAGLNLHKIIAAARPL
jgi:hypothetical protein